ncbi:MAG: TetR family transcriptional regulator [Nitrospinaceae bacterium]|nr:TetR/AcrR family transcriptional regulator [Nitrospinaceae bacterium]NIR54367.1 TetR/AcrR family transcriptional regulator [Nitrospinaceae bacterium]NIS84785.1 TetR/AcrR family transcriptional regulator [Nitrospinaceae bacterium]NIT81586.1 TetR/AcrR family transcriptional regulator [Nitrospinaceae bacterium]NIU43870.1 TetR/AcrR family transcriptional regulator [Nitrospinaceae bacterium]
MATQKLATEIRREQIVLAALRQVAKHGLRKMSIAGVARQVGLVPSALYRHFKSKDEIIDALLDLLRSKMMGNIEIVKAETEDPEAQLHRLLELHAGLIRDNQAIPRILFSDEVYSGSSKRKGQMHGVLKGYLEAVAGIIREGQYSGRFRKDADPETLALMLVGIVVPGAILWHASGETFDITAHVEKGWRNFRYMIVREITLLLDED